MAIAKIGRARNRKSKLDQLEQMLLLLAYSGAFGQGYFPHKQGYTTVRKMLVEYNTKDFKERANYKSTRQYLLYLIDLYKIKLQCPTVDKQQVKKMILEAEELLQLKDIELENLQEE